MKKEKDNRVNASYVSVKEYGILFFVFAFVNGFHMWIYLELLNSNIFETDIQFGINILMGFVLLAAALVTAFFGFFRYRFWLKPLRKLSVAARLIAKGDFSIRIDHQRKDRKKDFVEVLFDDFNCMAEELQSIETLKSDFIASVSHEIKTPLAVIQSYAATLQNDNLNTDERHDYIKTIIEASQKLSTMVSNILKLNKLENQEIVPRAQPFDLSEQIRRCAVTFEEFWERKNISFDAELEETTVCYNEDMLEIVWNNLFSNAVKFTGPGGSIFINLKAQNGTAVVSIRDTGCGMDEATQKHIFDKFYQGDTSHAQQGNGLGLALVKKTLELIGASIAVESELGQGSTFTVFLKI